MKKHGLTAVVPKKKHSYADAGLSCKYAPNAVYARERGCWYSLCGYIRSYEGWRYLACVLDLGSREMVGYATSRTPDTALTKAALDNAIKQTPIDCRQLLFHSDQGCQYRSSIFHLHLKTLGIKQSMGRRGNCWDNAVMERFFRSLKIEHLNRVGIMNLLSVQ